MKVLFLAYQDQTSREWAPVARVSRDDSGLYRLVYTKGAGRLKNFEGFGRMNQLRQEYVSNELFPVLANRVLPRNRPEYRDYLSWLGLSESAHDELEELARTGGLRATDSIELIPYPQPIGGKYEVYFFARGLSHFTADCVDRVNKLAEGEILYLMHDFQNQMDPRAILMRTHDPVTLVGYAPKYYAHDFGTVAKYSGASSQVQVERVNPNAPFQYRLLCRMVASWPAGFAPCDAEEFQPITA